MAALAAGKRERDPVCDVCGHNHIQGVKCQICGHVGKYIVPGGPNRPNRGAIPPVPPGPLHAPNLTPPTIEGCTVANFQEVCVHCYRVMNFLRGARSTSSALSSRHSACVPF
jgi:hypothetical protein